MAKLREYVTLKPEEEAMSNTTILLSMLNDHDHPEQRDEYRQFVAQNYYISDKIRKNLDTIITDVNSWKQNKVYLLEAQYGSGKSHFISFLQLLMERHGTAEKVAREQTVSRTIEKNLFIVPICLGFEKRNQQIEQIITEEVERLIGKPIVSTSGLKNLMDQYHKSGTLKASLDKFIENSVLSQDRQEIQEILMTKDFNSIPKDMIEKALDFTRSFYETAKISTHEHLPVKELLRTIWEDYVKPQGYDGVFYILEEFFEYMTSWDPEKGVYIGDPRDNIEHQHHTMYRTLTDDITQMGNSSILIVSQDNPDIPMLSTSPDTERRATEMMLESEDFKDILMFRLFGPKHKNRDEKMIKKWWTSHQQIASNYSSYRDVNLYFPFIACFDEFKKLMAQRATTRVGLPIAYNTITRLLDNEEEVVSFDELVYTMIEERKVKGANRDVIEECLDQIDMWKMYYEGNENRLRDLKKVFLTLVGFHLIGRSATPESIARSTRTTEFKAVGGLNPWLKQVEYIQYLMDELVKLKQVTKSEEQKDGTVIYSYEEQGGPQSGPERELQKRKKEVLDRFSNYLFKHHIDINKPESYVARNFKKDLSIFVENMRFRGTVIVKSEKGAVIEKVPEGYDFTLVIVPFSHLITDKPPSKKVLFWNLHNLSSHYKDLLAETMACQEMIDAKISESWARSQFEQHRHEIEAALRDMFIEGKLENEDGEVKREPTSAKPTDHLSAALKTLFMKPPNGLYCWYDDGTNPKCHFPRLLKKFDPNKRDYLVNGFIKYGDNTTLNTKGTKPEKLMLSVAEQMGLTKWIDSLSLTLDIDNPVCQQLQDELDSQLVGKDKKIEMTPIAKKFTSEPMGLRKEVFDVYLYALVARKDYVIRTKSGDKISAVNIMQKKFTDADYYDYRTIQKSDINIETNRQLIEFFFSEEGIQPELVGELLSNLKKKLPEITRKLKHLEGRMSDERFKLFFHAVPKKHSEYFARLKAIVEEPGPEDDYIDEIFSRLQGSGLTSLDLFNSYETFFNREYQKLLKLQLSLGTVRQEDVKAAMDALKSTLSLKKLVTDTMPEHDQLEDNVENVYKIFRDRYVTAHTKYAQSLRQLKGQIDPINEIIENMRRISILRHPEPLVHVEPCQRSNEHVEAVAEDGRNCDCGFTFGEEVPPIQTTMKIQEIQQELEVLSEIPKLKDNRYITSMTSEDAGLNELKYLDDSLVREIDNVVRSIKTLDLAEFAKKYSLVNEPELLVEQFREYLKSELGTDDLRTFKNTIRLL